MVHFTYRTTCMVNGFIYIGVHSTNDVYDGYLGSGTKLNKAIKMFGRHAFIREVLQYFPTKQDAYDKESCLVSKGFLIRPDVYNVMLGGKRDRLGRTNRSSKYKKYKKNLY